MWVLLKKITAVVCELANLASAGGGAPVEVKRR